MSGEIQTKEQKDEFSKQKREEMRKKNEALLKRREEVLADQLSAEKQGSSITNACNNKTKSVESVKQRHQSNDDEWRAERKQIDEDRVARNSGKSREWDRGKLEEGFPMEDDVPYNIQYNGNRRRGNFSSRGDRRYEGEWRQVEEKKENSADSYDRGHKPFGNTPKGRSPTDRNNYKQNDAFLSRGNDRGSRTPHDKHYNNASSKEYEPEKDYKNTRKFPEKSDYQSRKFSNSYNNQQRSYRDEGSHRNYSTSSYNNRDKGNLESGNSYKFKPRQQNYGNRSSTERKYPPRDWSDNKAKTRTSGENWRSTTKTDSTTNKASSGTWSDDDKAVPVDQPSTKVVQTSGTWSDDDKAVPVDQPSTKVAQTSGTWSDEDQPATKESNIPDDSNKDIEASSDLSEEKATHDTQKVFGQQSSGTCSDEYVLVPNEINTVSHITSNVEGSYRQSDHDSVGLPENKGYRQPYQKPAPKQVKQTTGTWSDDDIDQSKESNSHGPSTSGAWSDDEQSASSAQSNIKQEENSSLENNSSVLGVDKSKSRKIHPVKTPYDRSDDEYEELQHRK